MWSVWSSQVISVYGQPMVQPVVSVSCKDSYVFQGNVSLQNYIHSILLCYLFTLITESLCWCFNEKKFFYKYKTFTYIISRTSYYGMKRLFVKIPTNRENSPYRNKKKKKKMCNAINQNHFSPVKCDRHLPLPVINFSATNWGFGHMDWKREVFSGLRWKPWLPGGHHIISRL